ncbi:hypothetical protein SPRG_13205 [Saprolegnia parasitica CBS 223.65]|uniref:WW domain-containing protein n=1 Tax=Saprolegnia parasitica (strain CBS 223.65) TaxID=695850 RepID=A0A067BST4_SAPPC|nr:hypothetical protein SPRG_13205 [Saprolegnia parasitica CBS 223.65]KDO21313.1 hypothetical protein SPRG_13205 [Saprolegnia parasitica CBS 223.65]|eukprot:XP_012207969.1 hypothetical protein SPRG_13205 [Saprolegnia parasitica CBS 223.65]
MDKSSPEYKEALHEHARTLGLDPVQEAQYLWIVEEALTAPLPDDWEQGETDDGTIYYFNVNSEESIWEHPMDSHYKDMIAKKKEEDAKKLAFNSAPKKDLGRRQTSVHEFDMVDTIEDMSSNKPAPLTSAGSAFGKDSKAWLLDDEDDFDVPSPTPMPKSFSIVSSIKKTEEHPVVSKTLPTPTPLLSTPVPPTTTATTAIKSMGSAMSTATSSSNNKEAEKQIDTLRAEITQLKKSHETAEKQAKTARDKLSQEMETLRRGKEAAETEAKEANYLRMKINELKTKVSTLEAQATKGDPDATRALDALRADVDAKTKEIAEAQTQLETAKDEHSRAIQKRDDSLAALKKEHAIEVEALQEQLLLRQATNITLQHSTGELEKLKKRISELEDDALKSAQDHAKAIEEHKAAHAEALAALALAQKKCSDADAAQASQRDELDAQTSQLQAKLKLQAKAADDLSQQLGDVERQLQDTKDKWRTATAQSDELALHVRRLEDKERSTAMAFADEKRLLEQSAKSWQDRLQAVQRELETLGVAAKAEKEAHAHALSVANDALNEMRREKERAMGQFGEVQTLKKDNEILNLDLGRVRDQKATLEFELRNLKQAQSVDTSQLMQYKVQIEEYARKEFMEKQRFEMLAGEKASVEKKIGAMEAQIQTLRAEHRTDLDKYLYRIRELESQNARLEYDISRAEEKFSTAEKWRLKEVSRVEQRDTELLEIKEELGRAKARNIEGENHHLINELRGQTKLLEQKIIELERALANEVSAKTQAERLWAAETDNAKKQWAAQIPQLAAAATQRASDEWKKRCDDMVEKIKAEYQDSWLQERQQTTTREAHWHEAKRDLLRQIQTFASEKDFFSKEISRLEDNNKHLMEQLHTIRVYLTQRPLHGTFPPPPQVVSQNPAPTNVATDPQLSSHLQHQLGVLHAQFQQLFEASTTPAPRSSHVRDYNPAPETPLPETAPSGAHLLEEKQRLIRSMEDVATYPNALDPATTTTTMDEEEWSKELEANRKPGQKHPTPSPGFADRVFYESLLRQNPESKMAKKWCIEYGVLEADEAAALCKTMGIAFKAPKELKKTSAKSSSKKKSNVLDDAVDDIGLHAGSHMEGVGVGSI